MPSTRPPPAPARGRVAYPSADTYTAGDAGAQPTIGESSTTQAQAIQAQAQTQAPDEDKPISTGGAVGGLLRRRTTTKRKASITPGESPNEARAELSEREKSTQGLKTWWKAFSTNPKSPTPVRTPTTMNTRRQFGVPLGQVLQYAGMSISTQAPDGSLNMWGEVPIAVAKCGAYLKGKTDMEGVFRISGSAKRMRDLQLTFDTGPDFGLHLDWTDSQYTPHDVATIFRRFLTQMPEPVIPCSFYNGFRDIETMPGLSDEQKIREYKRLIRRMPSENQFLLLYVLDLLGIFAKEADKNLMNAANLAVIFQPGILHHRGHDMRPAESAVSKDVVKFLIDHESSFVFGMTMKIASRQSSGVIPTVASDNPGALGTWQSPQKEWRSETPAGPSSPTPVGRAGPSSPTPLGRPGPSSPTPVGRGDSRRGSRTESPTRAPIRPPVVRRESGDSFKTAVEFPASASGNFSIPSLVPEHAVSHGRSQTQPRPIPSARRQVQGSIATHSSSSLQASGLSPRTSSLSVATALQSPISPRGASPRTARSPTGSRVHSPTLASSPARPQPRRADSGFMLPSDSDDEAPKGGYYIVEKPRSPAPKAPSPMPPIAKPSVTDLLPERPQRVRSRARTPRRRPSRGQTQSAEPAGAATGMYPSDSDDDAPVGGYIIYENKKAPPSTATLPNKRALWNNDGRTTSPKPTGASGLLRRKTLPSKRVSDFTNRMRRVVREA